MERREQAPQILTAEDIVAKLRQGVRETYEIELRGTIIPVRVLSIDEMNRIRQQAIKDTAIKGGDETDRNLNVQQSTLMLASTVPMGSAPMLSNKVLGLLSVDEVTYLFEQYIGVLGRVNPSIDMISAEEFRSIVDVLKKKSISVRDLSLRQLRGICSHFVDETPVLETVSSPQGN
jgi:hypothetical protein